MSGPASLDDELIRDYLAECREHLTTIEADLLAMEQSGEHIDEQLVNRVFRAAHSIKGGAGFFDLAKIRELAHKTENALDLIRSRQMVPTPEVASILLLAFDKLRELIADHHRSNEADISDFVSSLTALAAASLPADERSSLSEQVEVAAAEHHRHIQVSAFDLSQARKGGKFIYLIQYDLIHDIERRGTTPWAVFRRLIECGTLLETVFDLESAGTLEDEPSNQLILEVLYATVMEPDMLGGLVEVPLDRVRLIEKDGSIRPLGLLAPVPPPAASAPALPGVRARGKKAKRDQPLTGAAQNGGTDEESQSAETLIATTPAASTPVANIPIATTPVATTLIATTPAATTPVATIPAASTPGAATQAAASPADSTIRLNVSLLDSLMTLAGELVLSRNQLVESLSRHDERGIQSGAQRVSLVTSELQEVVTLTRMQPVGSLFAKFPRLVRDLARDLGKDVQLKMEGGEVEIDKTILEGLSDPLTHMVRNAVDHGIERAAERVAAGKPAGGTVTLKASHQAGQVVIEISDDGKGLAVEKIAASSVAKGLVTREQAQTMSDREKMALIFLPGVSTAADGQRCLRPRRGDGRGQNQSRPAGRQNRNRFGSRQGFPLPHQTAADPGHHSVAAGLRRRRAFRHPAGERGRADPHPRRADCRADRPGGRCRGVERARPAGAPAVSGRRAGHCRAPAREAHALNVVLRGYAAPSNTAWWWRNCTTPWRSW